MKVGINPYLFFDGCCREALEFYARVLGGEIAFIMPYGGSPAEGSAPAEWKDKILHATLMIGDQVIMGSDGHPGYQKTPQGFSLSCQVRSVADAEHAFAGLSEGGTINMPLAETFFSERFGMLTDRYGMAWMVNFGGAVEARNAAAAKSAGAKSAGGASAPVKPRSGAARTKA